MTLLAFTFLLLGTGCERAPLPAPVSFTGLAATLMPLTWNSLGCQHRRAGLAPVVHQLRGTGSHLQLGAGSNLIRLLCWKLCRYTTMMLLRPPSDHLLNHLLGCCISLTSSSPKLYFCFVSSQQELNRISIQSFLTPVAFGDRRFTPLL